MTDVPAHQCSVPYTEANRWTCPTCGQWWFFSKRHTTSGSISGWQRTGSTIGGPGFNVNLRRAYELEQVAAALPGWQMLSKAQARREARTLRRLENQR